MSVKILVGDVRTMLATLPDQSVHTVVTSPPDWGLRDYGVDGQIGLEQSPHEFVSVMVDVFREVRRVLRDDGTLWLNLGDSYTGSASTGGAGKETAYTGKRALPNKTAAGLKPKDLIGIPWRVAFALQADGWYLRCDVIWHKKNPMPESVEDRPTKSHEYIFLMSKSERYYYDHKAIMEPCESGASDIKKMSESQERIGGKHKELDDPYSKASAATNIGRKRSVGSPDGRNKRSVWTVNSQPFPGAHFATFPPALIEPCILAGSPVGGVVLDPFGGAGTTGLVADRHGRDAILVELNPAYAEMARKRIEGDSPLFAEVTT